MPEEQQTVEEISIDTLPTKEYNEARDKGVTTVPKTPVVEEKEEEKTEEIEEKEGDKPKQRGWNGAQKKIDRLIKHNAELEKQKEAAEREREELRAKVGKTDEKATPKADDEPKEEDFNGDVRAFFKAQARWEARQEIKAQEETRERQQQEAQTKEIFDTHNRTISEARAKYEDFEEVVRATDTPWKEGSKADIAASQAFSVAMFESGMGGELLYYLGKHPDELAKMEGLSPARIQMAVGRIVDKLEASSGEQEVEEEQEEAEKEEVKEKPKIVSKAPAPIKPVGGSGTKSSVPLDKMSPADYNKAREAGRMR
jgi:colicin import membrane protein